MENGITFDTLAFSKQLVKEGGFSQQQAEALANAQRAAFRQMVETRELATRADIARLEAAIRVGLAETQTSMIKWTIGLIVALGAFLSALILGLAGKLPFA